METASLDGVGFQPWVGEQYGAGSRFGVRVLVLGESHYGPVGKERPAETNEVIRWFTQRARTGEGARHLFFTKVANVLRGQRGWIDDGDLAAVFQEVAFYNFVQSFVGDAARGHPTFRQWVEAQAPFQTVLDSLRPDAVLVLGLELSRHILDWPEHTEHAVVAHPASSRLRYDEAIPAFQALVGRAKDRGGRLADIVRQPSHDPGAATGVTSGLEVRDEPVPRLLVSEGPTYVRPGPTAGLSANQLVALGELYEWASKAEPRDLRETLETQLLTIDAATGQAEDITLELPALPKPDGASTLTQLYCGAASTVFRAAANDLARAPQVDVHLAAIDELVTNAIGLWRSNQAAARYLERPSPQLNGNAPIDLAGRSPADARQAAAAVMAMRSRLEELDARAQEIARQRPTPTPDTILQAAGDLFGDEADAQAFLQSPHVLLGGQRPLDVAKESEEGAARVARLLGQAQATTAI